MTASPTADSTAYPSESLIRATRLDIASGWTGGIIFWGRRPLDNGLAATGDVRDGGTKLIAHRACGA
eukprot:251838-Pyramimonas_sp.AAC.1